MGGRNYSAISPAAIDSSEGIFYSCRHGIADWVVGRMLGVRFAFYTVGETRKLVCATLSATTPMFQSIIRSI
jgi:hypothetical protein